MHDEYKVFWPHECFFTASLDENWEGGVLVFIWPKDDSTYLGHHNLCGLPEYFGSEACEGSWHVEDTEDVKKIASHMVMCGFTENNEDQ